MAYIHEAKEKASGIPMVVAGALDFLALNYVYTVMFLIWLHKEHISCLVVLEPSTPNNFQFE